MKGGQSQATLAGVTGDKSAYDAAAQALYQAPHESFVAKRQELAAELKGAGDKAAAARLAKLPRPSISAWAVNQLWWQARPAFDDLFETAAQVRAGKSPAAGAHRQAISKLTARARQLLAEHEHGGSEATLRRITMTLSALAALGSWDAEAPGMLSKDLDPPGFEAFGMAAETPSAVERHPSNSKPAHDDTHGKLRKQSEAKEKLHAEAEAKRAREREREAAAAEKKRIAERRAQHAAQKLALQSELSSAKKALAEHEQSRDRAARALAAAEHEVEKSQAKVAAAETRLAEHASE